MSLCTSNVCVRVTSVCAQRLCTCNVCVRATYVYVQRLCTCNVCVRPTSEYVQRLCTCNVCVRATSEYVQHMCTSNVCVRATSVYVQRLCTSNVCVRPTSALSCWSTDNGFERGVIKVTVAKTPLKRVMMRTRGQRAATCCYCHWLYVFATVQHNNTAMLQYYKGRPCIHILSSLHLLIGCDVTVRQSVLQDICQYGLFSAALSEQ